MRRTWSAHGPGCGCGPPLTPVVELEALRSGIASKRSPWATLEVWAGPLGLDPAALAELGARADAQPATVERTLQAVRPGAFVPQASGRPR